MDRELRRDLLLLAFSSIGIGILVCFMPGDPPAAEVALQWIKISPAIAGECKP